MRDSNRPTHPPIHAAILWLLSAGVAALVVWTLWQGLDYYATPLTERPHHPGYGSLRPAGRTGHGLGILGTAMVLLLLLYSVRKRARWLRRAGPTSLWLRYHIFLGVAGPVLITLHTSFKVEGLVALSYWSMLAVALSGLLGRYLYQQIPRNLLGEALPADAVERRTETLLVDLSTRWRLDDDALAALDALALGRLEARAAFPSLALLPLLNLRLRRGLSRWADALPVALDAEGRAAAREWCLLARRLHVFHAVRDLFHWWHVFHKPFAVIMLLIMVVHVGVAVALGYTWFGAA